MRHLEWFFEKVAESKPPLFFNFNIFYHFFKKPTISELRHIFWKSLSKKPINAQHRQTTCKSYKCFKRVLECEEEDLTLSNQYQDYIDQMSDEEDLNISDQYQSDDYESELEDSFESLENYDENTEFAELGDSFKE